MKPSDASGGSEPVAVVQGLHEVLDQRLSRVIQHAIEARLQAPYDNAWRTLLAFPRECGEATFIEGFLVIDLPEVVIVCEHGWLRKEDGSIIDPTILLQPLPSGTQIYYVTGIQRPRLEVALLLGKSQQLPAVRSDGRFDEDGMGHPHYQAAYHAARSHSFHRAHLSSPPKEVVSLFAQEPEMDLSGSADRANGEENPSTDAPTN
jgi:hypothetical protein